MDSTLKPDNIHSTQLGNVPPFFRRTSIMEYGNYLLDKPDLFFTEGTPIHTSSPIAIPRLKPICWCWRTTEPVDCR